MNPPASPNSELEQLVAEVLASPKYRQINPDLVRQVATRELAVRRNLREALKETRGKLHQVGAAYQEGGINYARAEAGLSALAGLPDSAPEVQEYCRSLLRQHASTRERLPILETFFTETLRSLGPIRSVLDLACGLTPLARPWMPLAPDAEYTACDIYLDLVHFLNQFFISRGQPGSAFVCDLTSATPQKPVQLALVLKTLPCLEQINKNASQRLLAELQAEHILLSFPARSLGGRAKGMGATYEAHFQQLTAGQPWKIQRFEFPGELAFLLSR